MTQQLLHIGAEGGKLSPEEVVACNDFAAWFETSTGTKMQLHLWQWHRLEEAGLDMSNFMHRRDVPIWRGKRRG